MQCNYRSTCKTRCYVDYDESVKEENYQDGRGRSVKNTKEKEKLDNLIKIKKWNPYCLRHFLRVSSDSDFLPEYALNKKVRWSMNSKQGSRYIKRRIGDDLKRQILMRN